MTHRGEVRTLLDEKSVIRAVAELKRLGVEVIAVEGSARNIKITNEEDLWFAEAILKSVVSGQ